ncbi:MAG TPA: PAS domain S-box protein [Anaerolineae bacterium]|nr:PAS domain S-box protein [Anaerolineae bacterium]HQK12826.1 PAS domain S-box protein [Anaerolineae bacterium]
MDIFPELMRNAALLLSSVLIFDLLTSRWHSSREAWIGQQIVVGLILGAIGVVVMLTPWTLQAGVVFDTRSVLLCISGLFFGPIPTLIAMLVTITMRLYGGGAGTLTGISVILATGGLGLIWRHMRRGALNEITLPELYVFGMLAHLIMLALMFTLPWPMALNALRNISLPVLVIYPVATALLGELLASRLRREKTILERLEADAQKMQALEALAQERQLLRTLIDNLPDAIYTKDTQGRKTLANRADLNNIGLPEEEVLGKTDAELFPPETAAAFMADDEMVLRTGVPILNREEFLVNAHDKHMWQLTSKLPLRDATGQITGLVGIGRDITEQKLALEALRERELLLNHSQKIAGMGSFVWDLRDDSLRWSRNMYAIHGLDETNFTGNLSATMAQLIHPDDQERVRAEIEKMIAARKVWPMEFRILRLNDGEERIIQSSGEFELDAQGQPIRCLGIHLDITERKRIEAEKEAVLESEREQRLRAETLRDVTLALTSALDISDVLMEILHQAQRLVPSTSSNIALLIGDALHIAGKRGYAAHGDDLTDMLQPLAEFPINAQICADGQPYLSADVTTDPRWQPLPETAWIRSHLSLPIRLGERTLGILRLDSDQPGTFTATDIERLSPLARAAAIALENAQLYAQVQQELAELQHSRAALEASERKFREMLENVRMVAMMLDMEGNVIFCNEFGLQLLEMTEEEVLGTNWFETFIPPEIRADMHASFLQHFAQGDFAPHYENEILTARGTRRALIAWNNTVIRDPGGNIIAVASLGEDVTAHRQAERALQENAAWLQSLMDSIDDVVFSLDREQRYTAVYGRWLERMGLSPTHFLGRTAREVLGPEAAQCHEAANLEVLTTGKSLTYEWSTNGLHFQTTLSPLRGPHGEIVGLVGVGRDITALKDYEAQLQAALDEKTFMLTEIHHRIKNNLQIILGLLELQFNMTEDDEMQQILRDSQTRIKAIALIHEQLYQSPGSATVNTYFYFQSLLRHLSQTYETFSRGIVIEQDIADLKLSLDLAIPCGLIVNELVTNALKYAFPPEWRSPDNAPPTIRLALRPEGNCLHLEVADNGVGLPPEVAMETSPGLGLRLIKVLTQQIDGELHTQYDKGTCVTITFTCDEDT